MNIFDRPNRLIGALRDSKTYNSTMREIMDYEGRIRFTKDNKREIAEILRKNGYVPVLYKDDFYSKNPIFIVPWMMKFKNGNDIKVKIGENHELESILTKDGFTLKENNLELLQVSNAPLIASLANDLEGTLKLGIDFKKINFSSSEYERVLEVLRNNNFVINKKNVDRFGKNKLFITASLKNDPCETLRFLDLKLEDNAIREYFIDQNIGVSFLNTRSVQDYTPLLYHSEEEFLFVKRTLLSGGFYSKEDKLQLLRLLKKEDKSSIEEVIVEMENVKRSEMSILEMSALAFYTKKLSNSYGVHPYIAVFDYTSDPDVRGQYYHSSRAIDLFNGEDRSVREMIHTLHHELEHALQYKYIDEYDVKSDSDIDIYLMDMLIEKKLGKNYYEDNYIKISYEFDADFKAYLRDKEFFNSEERDYQERVDILNENEEIRRNYADNYQYEIDESRENKNDKYEEVEEMFLDVVNSCDEDDEIIQQVKYNKLLNCQFYLDTHGYYQRKSLLMLVKDYLTLGEEEDDNPYYQYEEEKAIYLNLIERRLYREIGDEEAYNRMVSEIKNRYPVSQDKNVYTTINREYVNNIKSSYLNQEKYFRHLISLSKRKGDKR